MQFAKLPVSALPFWCKLNDVSFLDTAVKDLGATRGFGLIAERALNSVETFDTPTLVLIPRDLVLSAEMIEEHSKVDHHFKELLDTAGGKVSFGAWLVVVGIGEANGCCSRSEEMSCCFS